VRRLLIAVAVLCAACSGASSVPPGARSVSGGCGPTALYQGGSETWARAGPSGLVQATSHDGNAVAFLFAHPLRAGEPDNPANKILWVVKQPRDGADLDITGHPLGATAPTVAQHVAADSGPGEIYPSIVNVPRAGCWQFTLSWNGHADTIELPYSQAS